MPSTPDNNSTSTSSYSVNQSIDSLNTSVVERSKETDNAPKLETNTAEEYLKWKRYINWPKIEWQLT